MSVPLNAEFTIAEIVEAILPRGSAENVGLYIHVDMRGNYYPPDRETNENWRELDAHRDVHLIFARPTAYTKVWSVTNSRMGLPKPEEFALRSDHDSCWRTDGLRDIHAAYMAIRKELAGQGAVWADIFDFNNVHIQRVEVVYERYNSDKHPLSKITVAESK